MTSRQVNYERALVAGRRKKPWMRSKICSGSTDFRWIIVMFSILMRHPVNGRKVGKLYTTRTREDNDVFNLQVYKIK